MVKATREAASNAERFNRSCVIELPCTIFRYSLYLRILRGCRRPGSSIASDHTVTAPFNIMKLYKIKAAARVGRVGPRSHARWVKPRHEAHICRCRLPKCALAPIVDLSVEPVLKVVASWVRALDEAKSRELWSMSVSTDSL